MKKKISIAILVIVVMIVAICVVGKRVGTPKQEAKQEKEIPSIIRRIIASKVAYEEFMR